MRVAAVGDRTLLGGISGELQEDTRESPLQLRLAKLARQISVLGYIAAAICAFSFLFYRLVVEADFSSAEMKVLSLFGTEDGILSRSDRYDSCRPNLPESTVEIKIEGGCHSYFGCYGMQEGDGVPSITAEEQINFTADAIRDFIFDKDT
jgi:hypothetical protein